MNEGSPAVSAYASPFLTGRLSGAQYILAVLIPFDCRGSADTYGRNLRAGHNWLMRKQLTESNYSRLRWDGLVLDTAVVEARKDRVGYSGGRRSSAASLHARGAITRSSGVAQRIALPNAV